MKKIVTLFFLLSLSLILVGCGSKNKSKDDELYFDDTGIAEVTHIVFTTESSYELKDVFKVGTRRSAYNDKKIGETTYEDVIFYITDSFDTTERPQESDEAKIEGSKLVRKKYGTLTVYAALKEDTTEEPNRGLHCVAITFSEKPVYGTYEVENDYLDSWIESHKEEGELDAKKATMTFTLKEDLTFTFIITEGYFGTSGYNYKVEAQTITGSIGWYSAGLYRRDNNGDSHVTLYFTVDDANRFTLCTGYKQKADSNSYMTEFFYLKDIQNNAQ